jgi:hypothetical protein
METKATFEEEGVMLRFKPNDAVYILPRYAHLYPHHSAVVIGAIPDSYRPTFNEYELQFPDGSMARLFEFQIIEDVPNYTTLVSSIVFDSSRQYAGATLTRGLPSGRQLIFQAFVFDVDMTIQTTKSRASATGQVLERITQSFLKGVEARLMQGSTTIITAVPGSLGVFKFSDFPRGLYNILVVIPQHRSRILGEFST